MTMYSGDEFYDDDITSGPTEAEHHDGIWVETEPKEPPDDDEEATGTDDEETEDEPPDETEDETVN